MEAGRRMCHFCYQLFSSKYISRHINICSAKNLETPFNNTNEISNNEDNFDLELQTQQNNIDNENFSVNTGNNFVKNQDELNENLQPL